MSVFRTPWEVAEREGVQARKDGALFTSNPYLYGSKSRVGMARQLGNSWNLGWRKRDKWELIRERRRRDLETDEKTGRLFKRDSPNLAPSSACDGAGDAVVSAGLVASSDAVPRPPFCDYDYDRHLGTAPLRSDVDKQVLKLLLSGEELADVVMQRLHNIANVAGICKGLKNIHSVKVRSKCPPGASAEFRRFYLDETEIKRVKGLLLPAPIKGSARQGSAVVG